MKFSSLVCKKTLMLIVMKIVLNTYSTIWKQSDMYNVFQHYKYLYAMHV